jgi:hypothetical protein
MNTTPRFVSLAGPRSSLESQPLRDELSYAANLRKRDERFSLAGTPLARRPLFRFRRRLVLRTALQRRINHALYSLPSIGAQGNLVA